MSDALNTFGRVLFGLAYGTSPIILTGGIASGIAPIGPTTGVASAISNVGPALGAVASSIGIGIPIATFTAILGAKFVPLPGATLLQLEIGQYPFANQAVAANAVIQQPLDISLKMVAPAQGAGDYTLKLGVMTALQATLAQHAQLGGTYTVVTPSFVYTDAILRRLVDISTDESKQAQFMWQWDFTQPLITQSAAGQALNNLTSNITNGTPTLGATSGTAVPNLGAAASLS